MTETNAATWLTQEAYDRLSAELAHLEGPGRAEVVARITAAREEGDLKENGGYHAAREEQGKQEARIRELKEKLRNVHIGTPLDDGVVEPGMKVTYKFVGDGDDESETFLLGAREIEPEGLTVYSPQSAMGAAINGKRKGDTVTYETEAGKTFQVEILDAKPFTG